MFFFLDLRSYFFLETLECGLEVREVMEKGDEGEGVVDKPNFSS